MTRHLRQLASESVVYGLSGIAARFMAFFFVPLYTRVFTPEDYGAITLVTTTMTVVTIIVVLALDNSAHRWYWETDDDEDRKRTLASWAWCQVIVSVVFAATMVLLAPWLARTIVGRDDEIATAFVLAAAPLPVAALNTVALNWLRMMRRPWATMGFSLATSLTNLLATLALVVGLGWGIPGVFAGQAVANIVGGVVAVVLMRGWLDPRRFDAHRLREMLRFALPLIPAAISFWVVGLADRYFVQLYASTAEVGLYAVGAALAAVVAIITSAFQQAWGPFALSIHKQPDARQVYANVFLVYLWVGCGASTALTLFAPEALRVLATEEYAGASVVVGFLTLSTVLSGLTYIASVGPSIVKTTTPTGVAATLAALLNIALNIILVPVIGMRGAALATLIAQAVMLLYLFHRAQQLYLVPYRFGPGLALLGLAAGLMALGGAWQPQSVWLSIVVKLLLCTLFLPVPLLFGMLSPAQVRGLFSAAHRTPVL